MSEEIWRLIPEFPRYEISNQGRIFNYRDNRYMRVSYTSSGHSKISLTRDDGSRHDRSVALLVAEAFVRQPNVMCDHILLLDGNHTNLVAENIAWRPRWFVWKYARQIKLPTPLHFRNLKVENITDRIVYQCIVEAGMAEGLLFENIWHSTFRGVETYPYGSLFEIVERV